MSAIAGRVASLHRWPVKSLAGEAPGAVRLFPGGMAGDRLHAVVGEVAGAQRPLTARETPRMLAWSAAYAPGDVGGLPIVTAPDGSARAWDDPGLPPALESDLGRAVTLLREPGRHDLPFTVLVTTEATRAGVEAGMGAPVDLRRFRTNLHLELGAPAFAEEGWEGRTLRIGEAELEILQPCERCVLPTRDPETQAKWPQLARWLVDHRANRFGVNARVVRGGEVRAGDAVELAPS